MKNLVCPISDQRVNEQVTRINALLTVVVVVLAFVLNSVWLLAFLMADFFIRAFTDVKYSPISFTSHSVRNALSLSVKMIDKAPKIFAARMGFMMSTMIAIFYIFNLTAAAVIVASVLIFFATLEFAFGICVGCMIYTYLILPFYKSK